jgi:hypothetical protein
MKNHDDWTDATPAEQADDMPFADMGEREPGVRYYTPGELERTYRISQVLSCLVVGCLVLIVAAVIAAAYLYLVMR